MTPIRGWLQATDTRNSTALARCHAGRDPGETAPWRGQGETSRRLPGPPALIGRRDAHQPERRGRSIHAQRYCFLFQGLPGSWIFQSQEGVLWKSHPPPTTTPNRLHLQDTATLILQGKPVDREADIAAVFDKANLSPDQIIGYA